MMMLDLHQYRQIAQNLDSFYKVFFLNLLREEEDCKKVLLQVAGWGYEVNNKLTEELRETRMPVVGQDTCYFSDQNFYNTVISNFTYCAGRSPGSGNSQYFKLSFSKNR